MMTLKEIDSAVARLFPEGHGAVIKREREEIKQNYTEADASQMLYIMIFLILRSQFGNEVSQRWRDELDRLFTESLMMAHEDHDGKVGFGLVEALGDVMKILSLRDQVNDPGFDLEHELIHHSFGLPQSEFQDGVFDPEMKLMEKIWFWYM